MLKKQIREENEKLKLSIDKPKESHKQVEYLNKELKKESEKFKEKVKFMNSSKLNMQVLKQE